MLLHGFLDAGGSWELVAQRLAPRGLEVVAIDFRGFGKSDWVSGGGYYHFTNYVADIDAVVSQLAPEKLVVVGHSMGGSVASLFTGTRPTAVHKLVLLEGIGPPAMGPDLQLPRTRTWLDQLRHPKDRRPLESEDDALRRLAATHPAIDRAILRSRIPHLTTREDGQLRWAHDPLHRTTSPTVFNVHSFGHFLTAITCPVLFIGGGSTGWHPEDEAERLAMIRNLRRIDLEGAGHMMHWTQPSEVADAIASFVLDSSTAGEP